jgi:hypothetical protein
MPLTNLGDKDFHIYEVNDSDITTLIPDANASGCDNEIVYTISSCDAPIRNNYEEPAGTPIPILDGFQDGVGQQFQLAMMPTIPMTLGNPFIGEQPEWKYEYKSTAPRGSEPEEAVSIWIREKFLAQTEQNLDITHSLRIAKRYLKIATDNQTKINISAKAKLLEKGATSETSSAYLFKCKDFAMRVFRMYYGIDRIQPKTYYLTSQIWLAPKLITTKSGNSRFIIKVDGGNEPDICCLAAIFINRKKNIKAGIEGSFNLRISELVSNADFDAISAQFASNISNTNQSYTDWANSVATYIATYHAAPPPSIATHNGEDTFMAKIGLLDTPDRSMLFGFQAAFSYGSEGTKSGRTSFKMTSFNAGINPYAAADVTAAKIFEGRNRAAAFEQAQRNAQAQYANQTKAAVVGGGPATPTTNTTIDLDNPVNAGNVTRPDVSTPTRNANNGGTTVPNNFVIDYN